MFVRRGVSGVGVVSAAWVLYLHLGAGSGDLLQRLAAQTLHHLLEALTLDLSQPLLLLHLQMVDLLLIAQLLLTSLRQALQLRLLHTHTHYRDI